MANTLLPIEERSLTPDQVAWLDKRRSFGMTLLVVSGQFGIITTVLLLWLVQDLTYAPGWAHPVAYYFAFSVLVAAISGMAGMYLRRGAPEF
jgi:hypothetical protein